MQEKLIARKELDMGDTTKTVQIYRLPASEGIVRGTQLLKLILPVMGGLADEMFAEESSSTPKTFSEMAMRILGQLDSFDTVNLLKRLLKDASVDGKSIDFDTYFMDNYGELILIVEFALKENFQSFFRGTGLKTRFFKALGAMTEQDQAESDEQ